MTMKDQKNWGDLQAFSPKKKAKELKPEVLISKTGSLKFNQAFFTAVKVKDPKIKAIKISYSKNNEAIVLTVKNSGPLDSFKFSGKSFLNVKAKPFFDRFEIDVKKCSGKYPIVSEKIPQKGKSWVIYLEQQLKK